MRNVELLKKVKEAILSEPKRLGMEVWATSSYRNDGPFEEEGAMPACGTVACIAGWVAIFSLGAGHLDDLSLDDREKVVVDAGLVASEALGLTAREAESLFHEHEWPQEFRSQFEVAWDAESYTELKEIEAEVTARRIDAFIAEKTTERDPIL